MCMVRCPNSRGEWSKLRDEREWRKMMVGETQKTGFWDGEQ